METAGRRSWSRILARLLASAVLFAIVLGAGRGASAASVSSSDRFDVHEHTAYCGCGVKCKQKTCCCGPDDAKPRTSVSTAAGPGPCMNAAPCGEPTPPNASTADLGLKAAALVDGGRNPFMNAGRPILPLACRPLPPRRSSRLDDPPERPDHS